MILSSLLLCLCLFALVQAEPRTSHSQIINERIIQLSRSLASSDEVYEVSLLSEALNIADVMAYGFLRQSCVKGGLLEPETDVNLCSAYPPIILRQIQGRLSSLYSKYWRAGGAIELPEMWLRHSKAVLTRLLEEIDKGSKNADYYKTMLMLITPLLEGRTESVSHAHAQQSNAQPSVVKEQNEPKPKTMIHPQVAKHCVLKHHHQEEEESRSNTIPPTPLAVQAQPQQPLPDQAKVPFQSIPPTQFASLNQPPQQSAQTEQDLSRVLREMLPGIPDEVLREHVTGKRPSEIEILL